jgi:hypothetical protein
MRILKYLVTVTLLASTLAGCYVEERGPRHPYHRDHRDHATVIIR